MFINGRQTEGNKKFKNPNTFVNFSQTIDYVYDNLEKYNPKKKRKVLLVFNDIIPDMVVNKKLSHTVTELFLRGSKFNISLVFYITFLFQST